MYYIGIKGTHLKTLGVVFNENYEFENAYITGPTTFIRVKWPTAERNFREFNGNLLKKRNGKTISENEIACVCIGMSGIGRPSGRLFFQEMILKPIGWTKDKIDILITTDAEISLINGCNDINGIVIISGTGSIVYGRYEGQKHRVGGVGSILGDVGSCYDIGLRGLKTLLMSNDKLISPCKMLNDKILAFFHVSLVEELIDKIYFHIIQSDDFRIREEIAEVSKFVVEKLQEEKRCQDCNLLECHCKNIIEKALKKLIENYLTTFKVLKINNEKITVTLEGGLFDYNETIFNKMIEKINAVTPNLNVVRSRYDSVLGALFLAIEKDINKKETQFHESPKIPTIDIIKQIRKKIDENSNFLDKVERDYKYRNRIDDNTKYFLKF